MVGTGMIVLVLRDCPVVGGLPDRATTGWLHPTGTCTISDTAYPYPTWYCAMWMIRRRAELLTEVVPSASATRSLRRRRPSSADVYTAPEWHIRANMDAYLTRVQAVWVWFVTVHENA